MSLAPLARRALITGVLLAAGCVAAGCSATPDSASGLRSWASQATYSSSTSLLRGDVASIDRGIGLRELKATHTACDGLGDDAATAIGELPTPDHPLTLSLNAAYSELVNAAQDCSDAPSFSAAGFSRYRRASQKAIATLEAASKRLQRLERR